MRAASTASAASPSTAAAAASSSSSPSGRLRQLPPSRSRLPPLLRDLSLLSVRGRLQDSRSLLVTQFRGLSSSATTLAPTTMTTMVASSSSLLAAGAEHSHADDDSFAPRTPSPPLLPNPAFAALGLPDDVCAALAAMGIMEPTEIQVSWSAEDFQSREKRRGKGLERKRRNDS